MGDGDDVLNIESPSLISAHRLGRGDDQFFNLPFEDATPIQFEGIWGDEGDDLIYGAHKAAIRTRLFGNQGNDKIVGGDEAGIQ